jgi:RNA polymerase sigma factor (sigma-70 family)
MPLDTIALDALYRAEAAPLAARLGGKFPDVAMLADDAVQRAFLKLREQEPAPDRPAAWVTRVAENWLRDQMRVEQRTVVDHMAAELAAPAVGPPTLTHTTTGTFTRETVRQVLEELSEDQRELLRLKYVEGQDYDAVASEMARQRAARGKKPLSKSSLGTTLSRARDQLRQLVETRLADRRRRG